MDEQIWSRIGWEHLPEDSFRLNVLMFGFDSVSRNTFIRKLPKSYTYLVNVLKGFVLQGYTLLLGAKKIDKRYFTSSYNIVGDGTPQALIPILTGKTELELPDTRKRIPNAHYVNAYPFIWNEFRRQGYVTAYMEDSADLGTFQYRLKGFDVIPAKIIIPLQSINVLLM